MGAPAAAGCAPHTPPRAYNVKISNFVFQPAALTVAAGDTVVFTNADIVPHTATARDSTWDSKEIKSGDGTWRLVASKPGKQAYYCLFHPNMQGTIEVR